MVSNDLNEQSAYWFGKGWMEEPCVNTRTMLTLVTLHATSYPPIEYIRLGGLRPKGAIGSFVEQCYHLTRTSLRKFTEREITFMSLLEILGSRETVCDCEE